MADQEAPLPTNPVIAKAMKRATEKLVLKTDKPHVKPKFAEKIIIEDDDDEDDLFFLT